MGSVTDVSHCTICSMSSDHEDMDLDLDLDLRVGDLYLDLDSDLRSEDLTTTLALTQVVTRAKIPQVVVVFIVHVSRVNF
jgi:hypothetical protein